MSPCRRGPLGLNVVRPVPGVESRVAGDAEGSRRADRLGGGSRSAPRLAHRC